jgi:hypothetical protein
VRLPPQPARASSCDLAGRAAIRPYGRPLVRSPLLRRLTCPRVLGLPVSFAWAHLTLWAPFRVGHHARIRPVMRDDCGGPAVVSRFPAAFRRAGVRFEVILCPLGDGPSLRSAYQAPGLDPNGVATFDTDQMRPGRVLPLPRGGGVLPTDTSPSVGACRFAAASPAPRWNIPSVGALNDEAYGSSLLFTLSVFPSPVTPGRDGGPWAFPRASHPAVTRDARRGGDGPLDTGPELHLRQQPRSSFRCVHWSRAASCRTLAF